MGVRALGLAAFLAAAFGGTAAHAELAAPSVGASTTWACTGAYSKEISYQVVWVRDGRYRSEGKLDGKAVWVEKPVGLEGLTLFHRRDRNDGKGEREQRFDEEDFAGYADLEPGAEFSGDVRERHDSAKWDWLYEVEVGAPKNIAHPLLGDVTVIPVSEKRRVRRGSYSSQYDFLLHPENAMVVSWTYKDDKGVQECGLKEYSRP